jgi:hypothetical protein
MHRFALLALALTACHLHPSSHIDGGVLGRVVVYRNGVAFYERNATVEDGRLTVHVPRDKVDDFLKSLTVVDRVSRKPLSVTIPRKEADNGSYLTMTLETPDAAHADVLITYVTDAPSWKPSYRIVVGDKGKVMLEGWAVVDNTTSEDWKGVLVGVGASSALAFRYDLWSVHQVERDLLQGEERFATAPPTGVSPYEASGTTEELANLDGSEVRTFEGTLGASAGSQGDSHGTSIAGSTSTENTYIVDGLNTTALTADGNELVGVIMDKQTGEPVAGVTITANSPAMNGTQTAITDERGNYRFTALPPGTYSLNTYYGDSTMQRNGVIVTKKKGAIANLTLDNSKIGGETIQVTGSMPVIDQGSSKTGVTISRDYTLNVPGGRTFDSALGSTAGRQIRAAKHAAPKPDEVPPPVRQGDTKLKAAVDKVLAAKRDVLIESHGASEVEARSRAEAVRNKLVDDGVPAARIHVVPQTDGLHQVRVLAVSGGGKKVAEAKAPPTATTHGPISDAPVGESHFIADRPMTVRAGTSAMVAMVHRETTGGVVYLYDPLSDRGDKRYAFKSVRLDNPTTDTLEPGPVTVYGDGRFIGEGITEPVPPSASVVIPFALDRQIVVERDGSEEDRIAKLLTVQRGVLTAEVQHRRQTKFAVTSRLNVPAKVFLRHRLASGWELVNSPKFMKVGDSELFELVVEPGKTEHVTVVEATPVERTIELTSDDALNMMKVYVDDPAASPELRAQISTLLATHQSAADMLNKIDTLRDQIGEYRSRAGELHAQIVTLKAVKTGGELMATLKAKLAETSERIQKATIAIVDTQEQLMLIRVKFQNQLAELHLTDVTTKAARAR